MRPKAKAAIVVSMRSPISASVNGNGPMRPDLGIAVLSEYPFEDHVDVAPVIAEVKLRVDFGLG